MVFHMSPTGRAVLGEPPPETSKDRRHGPGGAQSAAVKERGAWADNLPEFSVTRPQALIALGVLAVLAVGYFVMNRPSENLGDRAKDLAEAFAANNLAYIKGAASSDSLDDVVRWYDLTHPQVEEMRKQSMGQNLLVTVLVIDENRSNRKGQVSAFIAPAKAPTRTETIASEAGASPKAAQQLSLYWVLDGSGRWKLDGHQTFGAASSTPALR